MSQQGQDAGGKASSAGTSKPPTAPGVKFAEVLGEQEYLCKELLWDSPPLEVQIERVEAGHEIPKAGTSKTDKRAVLFFVGKGLGLVLNKTNAKFLIRSFGGNDTSAWVGQKISIYVDKTARFGADRCGGIRVGYRGKWSGVDPRADENR